MILEEKEYEEEIDNLMLIKPITIRWLSKFNAINRILEMYPAIVRALEEIQLIDGDPYALGLVTSMTKFKFVGLLHFISDMLIIIKPL